MLRCRSFFLHTFTLFPSWYKAHTWKPHGGDWCFSWLWFYFTFTPWTDEDCNRANHQVHREWLKLEPQRQAEREQKAAQEKRVRDEAWKTDY